MAKQQFGMQMPGGRQSRGSEPDVYTALMALATLCLLAGVAVLWLAGSKVSPASHPFAIQEAGRVQLSGSGR